jgi:hypothetical protein
MGAPSPGATMPKLIPWCGLLLAFPLAAQSLYIPDNNATAGTCNVIPFGSTPGSVFAQERYQCKANVADLGGAPGLITGLGFAPCASGSAHFGSIEIILDHQPPGTPLSTTFAANLTPAAITVLLATDYTWNLNGNAWNEVGLQNYFPYDGVDDLVMQVTIVDGTSPPAFHRDVRPRITWFAASGTPPAVGALSSAALKFEVSMLGARLSTYGVGCTGSNALAPQHSLGGSAQLGQTVQMNVGNGPASSAAFLLLGFYNGTPFPIDLGAIGMPGCLEYFSPVTTQFIPLDAAGFATTSLFVPNMPAFVATLLWSQFACIDPPANATGVTTSNYGRIFVGL